VRLILLGPPGSGKGTQAEKLQHHYGILQISTGDMLRKARDERTEFGEQAAHYMQIGALVPDEIVINIVRERLVQPDCGAGYILDGFPRAVSQAKALDDILDAGAEGIDAVINLVVPDEELIVRLLARKREDDNEETIRNRLKVYTQQTEPLVDYYRSRGVLKEIDGVGTIDEVFDRILRVLPNGEGADRARVG